MGMKPRHPSRRRNNFPLYDDGGNYLGSACAEYLTTDCQHLNDVTVFYNRDAGVTELYCNNCRCTWEKVID